MQDHLEHLRADAVARIEQFQTRYQAGGNRDAFISIAQRWRDALQRQDPDPNELSDVIKDAEKYRFSADVAFFGFLNGMYRVRNWLWEQYLIRNAAEREAKEKY